MGQNNSQTPEPRTTKRRALSFGLSVAFASVVATFVVATVWSISAQREQTLRQDGQDELNLAWTLSERVSHALESADEVLAESYTVLFEQSPARRTDTRALAALLNSHLVTSPELRSLELFDPQGALVVSAQSATGLKERIDQRDFFVALREHPELAYVVGLPVHSGPEWLIPVARRAVARDGSPLGVLVTTVGTGPLRQAIERLNLDERTVFCVGRVDGRILFRHPYLESAFGSDQAGTQLHRARTGANGTVVALSAVDGIERLYAYTRLASFPVTVTVGAPTDT